MSRFSKFYKLSHATRFSLQAWARSVAVACPQRRNEVRQFEYLKRRLYYENRGRVLPLMVERASK